MLAHRREQAASCLTDTRAFFGSIGYRCRSRHRSQLATDLIGASYHKYGTQPGGASRSPTFPPLCDDGFAYRFPQSTHCFSSWTRRTATTNHCADILCRHSLLRCSWRSFHSLDVMLVPLLRYNQV